MLINKGIIRILIVIIAKNGRKKMTKIFPPKKHPGSLINQELQKAGFYGVPYLKGIDTVA